METFLTDLRHAVRSLFKRPAFFAVATVSLALGISANTVIFATIDGFMLRPLPYPDADRILRVWTTNQARGWTRSSASIPDYLDWRRDAKTLELGAYTGASYNLSDNSQPERVPGGRVTPSLFAVMGTRPLLGRTFSPEEARPGGPKVVVIGHAMWERRYAGDPSVIGRAVKLNGDPHTIIGVMPAQFRFPSLTTDLWTPLTYDGTAKRGDRSLSVVGHLRPGVTTDAAANELATLAARSASQFDENRGIGVRVQRLQDAILGEGFPRGALISTIAVIFVLLIACANVANLLLARATARARELALRTAIGASRGRLVRQLLTESIVLSLVGGALGVVFSIWGVRAIVSIFPPNIPGGDNVALNLRALAYTFGVSIVAGIVFGVVPAFSATGAGISHVLREGGRSASMGLRRNRLGASLVVTEIALALVLLISAGLLIKGAIGVQKLDMGFDRKNLLTMRLVLTENQYGDTARLLAFQHELATRLSALPAVVSVGATSDLPAQGASGTTYAIEGQPPPEPGREPFAQYRSFTPGYLATMRFRLVSGRDFNDQDRRESPIVALVNEAFVKRNWPSENPIGKRLLIETTTGMTRRDVVGVVADVRESGADADVPSMMYFSAYQLPLRGLAYVIRTTGDPSAMSNVVRGELAAMDPTVPAFAVQTMETILELDQQANMIMPRLLTVFGAIALVLAVVGVYGVISYSVNQRTQEVGIRMALGAQRRDILRLVLRQGATLAVLGLVIGLALAVATTRALSFFLLGVSAFDPAVFGGVSAALVGAAVAATAVPALRALRVDPLVALRSD